MAMNGNDNLRFLLCWIGFFFLDMSLLKFNLEHFVYNLFIYFILDKNVLYTILLISNLINNCYYFCLLEKIII